MRSFCSYLKAFKPEFTPQQMLLLYKDNTGKQRYLGLMLS